MSNQSLIKVNEKIVDDIKHELRLQGHYAFGHLEESFRRHELKEGNEYVLTAEALAYIEELESGVPASGIKTDSANFDGLVKWVELKIGARGKAAASVAYAIIRKWKQEGKPLETSRRFSRSGEIKHAIQITFQKNESTYFEEIDKAVITELDTIFTDKIKSGEI
jgi:hypothetical protein